MSVLHTLAPLIIENDVIGKLNMTINFKKQLVTLPRGTSFQFEWHKAEVRNDEVAVAKFCHVVAVEGPSIPWRWDINPQLAPSERAQFIMLLYEYRNIFTTEDGGPDWSIRTGHKFRVELKDPKVPPVKAYMPQCSREENEHLRLTNQKWVEQGIVQPSNSP